MMPHLKNDSGGFPCHWWKKSVHTNERCWIQEQFVPARVHGVMQLCWFKRRMEAYAFARISEERNEERFLPTAKGPGGTGELGWCWPFFMPRPKVWILANQDGWATKTVHFIYHWQFRLLWMLPHAFWIVKHTSHVSEVNAKLPWGAESNIPSHLPWWHSYFLTDSWRTSLSLVHCFWLI